MPMDLFAPIDVYCERTSDAFWSEPLNAWTNLAFLLAAGLLLPTLWELDRFGRSHPAAKLATPARVLLVELVMIGLGSFAFHTYANGLAAMADVGSIAVFILTFVGVYLRRALGAPRWGAIVGPALLLAASIGTPRLLLPLMPDRDYGYVMVYGPTVLAAAGLGFVAMRRGVAGGGFLVAAAGVFVLSMIVTGLDQPLCDVWPYGTHFIWHLLNACVLYLAMRGLLASADRARDGEETATRGESDRSA